MRGLECHSEESGFHLERVGNVHSRNICFFKKWAFKKYIYINTYSWPGPGHRAVNETDKNACSGEADILVQRQPINTKMNKNRGSPMAIRTKNRHGRGPGVLEGLKFYIRLAGMHAEKVT